MTNSSTDKPLIFLKLGGSLITRKDVPHTPRLEVLSRLAREIASAWQAESGFRLLLGHGSGSFGHVPARQYATRQGVYTRRQWLGFVEVWKEAAALDRLVVDSLQDAGLPVIALPASASVTARSGTVEEWNLAPLEIALQAGLLPVIYGDVVFDLEWGGTILSTENLFAYLARRLRPHRLLLAGIEEGVWADYPARRNLIPSINDNNVNELREALAGSEAVDVTGGMLTKVVEMLALVREIPGLQAVIFSGEQPGTLEKVLLGEVVGTVIC